jgi:hypothetical protein
MNRFFIIAFLVSLASSVETSCYSRHYTRQETIENFERNGTQILELADYFMKLKPDSNEIYFEPHVNRYTISIALPNWAITPNHPSNAGRNMKIESDEMNAFLKTLGWTTNTVLTLKDMLNKANFKSISSHDDYLQLNYRSDDICSFYYFISQRPFADSTIEKDTKAGITFLSKNVRIGSSCAL